MVDSRNFPVEQRYEDEIDLVEFVKILLKNLKFIFIFTFIVGIIGMSYSYYLKKSELSVTEQKFTINNFSELKDGNFSIEVIKVKPNEIFDNDEVVNNFFNNEFLEESINLEKDTIYSRRKILKNLYSIKSLDKAGENYTVSVSMKDEELNVKMISLFINQLNRYIESFNRERIKKQLKVLIEKVEEYEETLALIEVKILEVAKTYGEVSNKIGIEEIKELNPRLVAQRDTYSEVYNEILKEKLNLDRILSKMEDNITVRSSHYELDSSINMKLITLISFVLGFFLSIFIVFLREFIKNINWTN